jgi:hypothetical protein
MPGNHAKNNDDRRQNAHEMTFRGRFLLPGGKFILSDCAHQHHQPQAVIGRFGRRIFRQARMRRERDPPGSAAMTRLQLPSQPVDLFQQVENKTEGG